MAVAHFAERYGLFIIICLGESIVAIGLGATAAHRHLSSGEVVVVTLGLLITVGMWWTYFDRFARVAEASLRTDRDPVLAAADGYSYVHLILVAGIITFAAGVRLSATFVLPAKTSYAAESAAASAADWFCRLIAYHSPVSAASAAKPIKTVRLTASTITTAMQTENFIDGPPRHLEPGAQSRVLALVVG